MTERKRPPRNAGASDQLREGRLPRSTPSDSDASSLAGASTWGDNTAGQPSWWLYAANNEMVAWAGETFASRHNAQRAAAAFKAGAKTARYDIYQDAGGAWRWRAWRGS